MASKGDPPTIEEHIDAIGIGPYQVKIFLISALVAIADGCASSPSYTKHCSVKCQR